MLRLRGQMSVEIHVVALSEAWQPGVFNYIKQKLKFYTTVGQVAQWLGHWNSEWVGVRRGVFEPLRDHFFSDSISDIRGTLFCQGTISGHSNSNLKLENRCEEYKKIDVKNILD